MKYDEEEQQWMYWNDSTLTGLTLWQDQVTPTPTETVIDMADFDDKDSEDESSADTGRTNSAKGSEIRKESRTTVVDMEKTDATDLETSTRSAQQPGGQPATAPNKTDSLSQKSTQEDSPPLLPSQTPRSTYTAQNDVTQTGETQQPGQRASTSGSSHQEWMRSPARTHNPYTGRMIPGPIPNRLQVMMEELQNHTDWYEEGSVREELVTDLPNYTTQGPPRWHIS